MSEVLISFLVPVILGYAVIKRQPCLKFSYEEENYNTLIFHSFLYGLLFLFFSYILIEFFKYIELYSAVKAFKPFNFIQNFINILFKEGFTEEYTIAVFLVLMIILFGPGLEITLMSGSIKSSNFTGYIISLREKNSTEFEKLLIYSFQRETPLIFTLSNRKVYIGILKDLAPNQTWDKTDIQIIPLISGYRDPDTLTFKISCNYAKEFKKSKSPALFFNPVLLIKRQEIISVAQWSEEISYQDIKNRPKCKSPLPSYGRFHRLQT